MARRVSVGELQRMQRGPSHVALGESEALGDAATNGHNAATVDPMTGRVVDADPLAIDPLAEDAAATERLREIGCGPVEPKPEDQAAQTVEEILTEKHARGLHDGLMIGGCAACEATTTERIDPLTGMPEDTAAWRLQRLGVELLATAEWSLAMIRARVEERAMELDPYPSDDELAAEADRIWRSFGENRTGPAERKPDWRDVVKARGLVADVNPDGTLAGLREPEMTPDRGPDVGTTVHTVTGDDERFSGGGAPKDDLPVGSPSELIPSDRDFNGKLYREAPELANLADQLIDRHGFLSDLENCDIRWYWKRKTGVSKGRVKIGFMKRASDLLGHFSGADFIGWLSATTARDGKFTSEQVEAAVFHQLLHIGQDDKGNWIFLPHDFEGFGQEVRHYGTWTEGLKLGGTAFIAAQQMGLFDASDDEDDDEDGEDNDEGEAAEAAYFDAAGEAMDRDITSGAYVPEDEPADPDGPPPDELDGDDPLTDVPFA